MCPFAPPPITLIEVVRGAKAAYACLIKAPRNQLKWSFKPTSRQRRPIDSKNIHFSCIANCIRSFTFHWFRTVCLRFFHFLIAPKKHHKQRHNCFPPSNCWFICAQEQKKVFSVFYHTRKFRVKMCIRPHRECLKITCPSRSRFDSESAHLKFQFARRREMLNTEEACDLLFNFARKIQFTMKRCLSTFTVYGEASEMLVRKANIFFLL